METGYGPGRPPPRWPAEAGIVGDRLTGSPLGRLTLLRRERRRRITRSAPERADRRQAEPVPEVILAIARDIHMAVFELEKGVVLGNRACTRLVHARLPEGLEREEERGRLRLGLGVPLDRADAGCESFVSLSLLARPRLPGLQVRPVPVLLCEDLHRRKESIAANHVRPSELPGRLRLRCCGGGGPRR